jgi:hypothetical protein
MATARAQLRLHRAASTAGLRARAGAALRARATATEKAMTTFLRRKGPMVQYVAHLESRMNMDDAVRRLDGRLPADVAALVKETSVRRQAMQMQDGAQNAQPADVSNSFDEESIQKARAILNDMMYKGWLELDDLIFEYKNFVERNREPYKLVVKDIEWLGSHLADLDSRRVDAANGIAEQDDNRKEVQEEMMAKRREYLQVRTQNQAEMDIRKNDLAVFDFILELTKCPDSLFLAQKGSRVRRAGSASDVQVCFAHGGGLELHFNDPKLQSKIERMMTPEARNALHNALGQVHKKVSLLQFESEVEQLPSNTTPYPTYVGDTMPVSEEPHPEGQWKKCAQGEPNCGMLSDMMAIEWGKFRDSFDELAKRMKEADEANEELMANFNEQLSMISEMKTKYMEELADTISSINSGSEEEEVKNEEARKLDEEWVEESSRIHEKSNETLFTKICAVRRIRNEILSYSTDTPPDSVNDCDFTDWTDKDGLCWPDPSVGMGRPIMCDDSCPQTDPFKCGGSEMMKRDVLVAPNQYGMACPPMERPKKCKQVKCPVDCVLSEWSGWSKCSKDCESGVQTQTRSILTKPKYGGDKCDTPQEIRSCNTMSCDRNCRLDSWSEWSPCSMACGGGITEKTRAVLIPVRGRGKCPREHSRARYKMDRCNTHKCEGDEICIAKQDLVVLVDGSGSMKEPGFDIIKNLAVNLTGSYQSLYYGEEAVHMGVVEFGNGVLEHLEDGRTVVGPAMEIQGLTGDLELVRTSMENMQWLKGFTNMAQGATLAGKLFESAGRTEAQSAVLVLSDGRYSMYYQTAEAFSELRDKNVQIFMAPISGDSPEVEALKSMASKPWMTNFQRIPSFTELEFNAQIWTTRLIQKFCPDAFSPSLMSRKEKQRGYLMIHESGYPSNGCGTWIPIGHVQDKDACDAAARSHDYLAFSYGKGRWSEGYCYAEAISVTSEELDAWELDRHNPACPNGYWIRNPYFDTYAMYPNAMTF